MEYEGDVTLLRQLANENARIGLLSLAGGNRGIVGGSVVAAMEKYGLQHKFKILVGISTGAPQVAYFAAGVANRGRRIYYEVCTTPEYMMLSRRQPVKTIRRFYRGNAVDLDHLCSVFRGEIGSNSLDVDALCACKANVYVGVTDYATGEGRLINLKTALPDSVAAIHASIAMPHVYRKPVIVNGKRYLDGTGALVFPAREIVESWNLSGLLVITNGPRTHSRSLVHAALEFFAINLLPPGPRRVSRKRHLTYGESLTYLRGGRMPYLIIYSDVSVHMFEQNPEIIKSAGDRAYEFTLGLLKSAGIS